MTVRSACDLSSQQIEHALVSELFHAISQPLTALECGFEVSLRRDKTAVQFRTRVASALVAVQLLHQRLMEARALQDAGEPGDNLLSHRTERTLAAAPGRLSACGRVPKDQAGSEVRNSHGSRQ